MPFGSQNREYHSLVKASMTRDGYASSWKFTLVVIALFLYSSMIRCVLLSTQEDEQRYVSLASAKSPTIRSRQSAPARCRHHEHILPVVTQSDSGRNHGQCMPVEGASQTEPLSEAAAVLLPTPSTYRSVAAFRIPTARCDFRQSLMLNSQVERPPRPEWRQRECGTCSSVLGKHGGTAVSILSVRALTAKMFSRFKTYDPSTPSVSKTSYNFRKTK